MAATQRSGHRIIIVSDGTGETAAQMTKAAMVQFSNHDVYFTRYKNVRNEAQIEAICEDAATQRELLVYTIVSPQLRAFLQKKARENTIPCVDLLGILRTSKTPLSMYLSHQGWKVANIPLINGFELPKELFEIEQRRVIGLTIDPEDLATIRRARLERLGQDKGGDYADPDKVNEEI